MQKTFFFTFLLFICLSSNSQITDEVINKLIDDKKSFKVYIQIYQEAKKKKDMSFDLYIKLYNKGIPLVRLYEYKTIIKSFKINNNDKAKLKCSYDNLVRNKNKLINDDRSKTYFNKYIKNYYIIPPTN
jgi:hypothetical protein